MLLFCLRARQIVQTMFLNNNGIRGSENNVMFSG